MKYDKALLSGLGYIAIGALCIWIGLNVDFWRPKPEILIKSETFVKNLEGQTVLLVDYMVGGMATNATFTEDQMDEYQRVMAYLKRIGRVSK
jgi:hypothetical protein